MNELANNDQFQGFVENAIGLLAQLAVYVLDFFNTLASIGAFISDNWSIIAPIVYGVVGALGAYLAITRNDDNERNGCGKFRKSF